MIVCCGENEVEVELGIGVGVAVAVAVGVIDALLVTTGRSRNDRLPVNVPPRVVSPTPSPHLASHVNSQQSIREPTITAIPWATHYIRNAATASGLITISPSTELIMDISRINVSPSYGVTVDRSPEMPLTSVNII